MTGFQDKYFIHQDKDAKEARKHFVNDVAKKIEVFL